MKFLRIKGGKNGISQGKIRHYDRRTLRFLPPLLQRKRAISQRPCRPISSTFIPSAMAFARSIITTAPQGRGASFSLFGEVVVLLLGLWYNVYDIHRDTRRTIAAGGRTPGSTLYAVMALSRNVPPLIAYGCGRTPAPPFYL